MIPDYQSLMRPVLECAAVDEVKVSDAVGRVADKLALSSEDRALQLPSGGQTMIANRVHWAKLYLVKAGLVEGTRHGYFRITPRGTAALADPTAVINNTYLDQFPEFREYRRRETGAGGGAGTPATAAIPLSPETPDEALRPAPVPAPRGRSVAVPVAAQPMSNRRRTDCSRCKPPGLSRIKFRLLHLPPHI